MRRTTTVRRPVAVDPAHSGAAKLSHFVDQTVDDGWIGLDGLDEDGERGAGFIGVAIVSSPYPQARSRSSGDFPIRLPAARTAPLTAH
jgi:hypothetical protein